MTGSRAGAGSERSGPFVGRIPDATHQRATHEKETTVMTKLRALIGASLVLVVSVGAVALVSTPARAQGTSWTKTATCPSGLALALQATDVHTRTGGTGEHAWWWVTGRVTVTAANGRSSSVEESYLGRDTLPAGSGGTEVTGTSIEFAPNGTPSVVRGTAYLAPDGLLGRVDGTATSLCEALGA